MASEDPIAHTELEALSRRTVAVEDRVESLQVQSGGNFAAVIEGQAALRREVREGFTKVNGRFDALEGKVDQLADEVRSLNEKVDRNQARIVELLTQLVGKSPDAS
ncbi:hypothetical protein [Streptomyces monomycini]|uniref:hypothetical protein n=1 Tax=Streptomyces monomycini TaxID=371720 RepID=UPI0004AA6285|nr:hypothetical protein [Streptomyces monomycini]